MGSTNRQHKTGQRALAGHAKALQALEARRQGMTYEAIAKAVGYADRASAYKAVMSALQATLREPAEAVREIELQRLDQVIASMWPGMAGGDPKAAAIVLRALERRATMLGLDAPAKSTVEIDIRKVSESIASELGLPVDEVIAEAEAIVRGTAR